MTQDHGTSPDGDRAVVNGAASVSALRASVPSAGKHLASAGAIGFSGRRCGTAYAYTARAVSALRGMPWFRFRNAECEAFCRAEWKKPAPTESDIFTVAPESERPDIGISTRIDRSDPLRDDPLVKWELEGLPWGKSRFYRIGDGPYFEFVTTRDGIFWSPAGRLLKMKSASAMSAGTAETAQQAQGDSPPARPEGDAQP